MIINNDCMDAMRDLIVQGIQVDSIVTDPPYELGFMGKAWDKSGIAYNRLLWKLCFDLLKPGGHLLSFGGSRTYHRMACAIEDAGFEIRDQIMWVYGQGFPKSLDISKAIDKMVGAEREVVGIAGKSGSNRNCMAGDFTGGEYLNTAPATESAKQWQGWGTALKPAHEPIVLARKPLSEKTIAENVLKHGTGGINVDGCRIQMTQEDIELTLSQRWSKGDNAITHYQSDENGNKATGHLYGKYKANQHQPLKHINTGRFPANLIHDGSDEVEEEFSQQSKRMGMHTAGAQCNKTVNNTYSATSIDLGGERPLTRFGDNGSASRFFYCAKASKKDRMGSKHPTVKPISLMRYLCRLITPPNGTILDPFAGSGTTGQAAKEEGFKFILIERESEYVKDIEKRLNENTERMASIL